MPAPEVVAALATRFAAEPTPTGVRVAPDVLSETMRALRDVHGYRYYVCASATERAATIEVLHGVRQLDTADTLFVTVSVPTADPQVASQALVYAGAEWHEREIYDLFGVVFLQHPDLRRILLPDEYVGHPLRKDFAMDAPWGYRPPTRGTTAP
jgi:NADH:ubiquinone oxidoreductase subunit C